jgi:outer membrane protein assembly factor BamE
MRMQPASRTSRFRAPALAFCLVAAALLTGCASKNPLIDNAPTGAPAANSGVKTSSKGWFARFFSPYKIDIQQGNFVSSEMLAQLKEGMTREQVRFVLGTPLLTDMFHADRWDYDFRLAKGNGQLIASRVSVFFNGDSLSKWDGGDLPTENEYLGFIAGSKPSLMPTLSDQAPAGSYLPKK